MSGFTGFVGKTENALEVLEQMLKPIFHRGPNSKGTFMEEEVAFGFRCLFPINNNPDCHPLSNEDDSLILLFDGEIYNYKLIREELLNKGHQFKTDDPSEILLHGYEEYGAELLVRLRGMFSFIIWDRNQKKMFAARDMFGIRPFYYALMDGTLLLGSEIKSFLPHPAFNKQLNKHALKPFLIFQSSVLNETFFKGVFKLPAAHFMTFENGNVSLKQYWSPEFIPVDRPLESIIEEIDAVVRESIQTHTSCNQVVGSFLSSGVDSSYVASVYKPNKTFTVGFSDQNFSEIDNAVELSKELGIHNINATINPDECFSKIEEIQYMMDEPHSNPSIVPLYFLSELASKHVKVVLSGEGADEFFGGYDEYDDSPTMRKYKRAPRTARRVLGEIASFMPKVKGKNFLMKGGLPVERTFIGQAKVFDEQDIASILKKEYHQAPSIRDIVMPIYEKSKGQDDVTRKQLLDFHLWLVEDILLKANKMSMAHSIHVRTPLLDKEVLAVATTVPTNYRVNPLDTKYAFRLAARRSLPEEWANRKKLGFPVPIRNWMKEEKYFNIIKETFMNQYAAKFFHQEAILRLLTDHYKGKSNNARKIWTTFIFLVWYKKFFAEEIQ